MRGKAEAPDVLRSSSQPSSICGVRVACMVCKTQRTVCVKPKTQQINPCCLVLSSGCARALCAHNALASIVRGRVLTPVNQVGSVSLAHSPQHPECIYPITLASTGAVIIKRTA